MMVVRANPIKCGVVYFIVVSVGWFLLIRIMLYYSLFDEILYVFLRAVFEGMRRSINSFL